MKSLFLNVPFLHRVQSEYLEDSLAKYKLYEIDFVLRLYAISWKQTCSFELFFSFQAGDAVVS